jgi:hypothetical protein
VHVKGAAHALVAPVVGTVFAAMLVHVPSVPGSEQLWQAPHCDWLQHTPSTHAPVSHVDGVVHDAPRVK